MPLPRSRALAALALAGTALAGAACGASPDAAAGPPPASTSAPSASPTPTPTRTPTPSPVPPVPELPRGGTRIFPDSVVVTHYGTAGTAALGVLGEGSPEQAAERLERAAAPFAAASGRPVLPAFELITTVASSAPGADGLYSTRLAPAQVQRYLDAARAHRMLLVLDVQPGRADFLDQVRAYESFLLQPDVGVALDPEWRLTATQRPLEQIGTTTAAALNEVSGYLSGLVQAHGLPEKLFVVHQFKTYQLPDREAVLDRPGLATVLHVDGFGTPAQKLKAYDVLAPRDGRLVPGLKLFYDEDTDLLTPAEALALVPQPQLFSYQ